MPAPRVHLLFVCLGNICRSPTAEGVMRKLVRDAGLEDAVEIDSAGTGGWHVGAAPDPRSTEAAQRRGITLEGAARRVSPDDFERYDLLLAMDRENLSNLRAVAPDEDARGRSGCCASSTRRRPARRTSTCPTRTTAASGASTTCSTSSSGRARGSSTRSAPGGLMLPLALAGAVEEATGRSVEGGERVGGGDINDAFSVRFADGGRAFLKTRAGAPAGEFGAEAAALAWLGEPGALDVPEVVAVRDPGDEGDRSPRFLALEWIDEGSLGADGAERARARAGGGPRRRGARVRLAARRRSGGAAVTLGPLRLPSDPCGAWPEFYAERRLRPLLRPRRIAARCRRTGRAVERVCARIDELAGPPEPPARLHGDLWTGNVLAADGRPHLIDPAAYGGHREVDLAMLRLFGGGTPTGSSPRTTR